MRLFAKDAMPALQNGIRRSQEPDGSGRTGAKARTLETARRVRAGVKAFSSPSAVIARRSRSNPGGLRLGPLGCFVASGFSQ